MSYLHIQLSIYIVFVTDYLLPAGQHKFALFSQHPYSISKALKGREDFQTKP